MFLSTLTAAAFVAALTPAATKAETIDKLTYLTFSGAVQVPGTTLDAGTYRFRLTNPNTARNVVQVLSYDGSNVKAMFNTLPDSRVNVTKESTVTFIETPAGVPPAVKSLFYGGEHDGYQFVYPKDGPILTTADLTSQPPVTFIPMPPQVAAVAPSSAPSAPESAARAEAETSRPSSEVARAEAEAQAPPAATAPGGTLNQQPAGELPRTASPLPMVALGGFASLIVGLGLGAIRRFVA